MAEKTIKHGSFWYVAGDGVSRTALRGETVDIERPEDLKRGERHGAFATDEDMAEGSDFRRLVDQRNATEPAAPATVEPAEVGSRIPQAGGAATTGTGETAAAGTSPAASGEAVVGASRPSPSDPKPAWVAYHVAERPDDVDEATARTEAEGWTKPQLVERAGRQYGATTPPPS